MPWKPVKDVQNVLTSLDLMRLVRDCPSCATKPGQPHEDRCDVERCSTCGRQRLSCPCEGPRDTHDKAFARWTGFWPGELECIALGFVVHWQPDPFRPVPADELCTKPGVDLNRFVREQWHRLFWIKPVGYTRRSLLPAYIREPFRKLVEYLGRG